MLKWFHLQIQLQLTTGKGRAGHCRLLGVLSIDIATMASLSKQSAMSLTLPSDPVDPSRRSFDGSGTKLYGIALD
jgi:hypothetical protein